MQLQSGVTLGPYEIVEPLGAGGMGEVYRARDVRLGRDVAVKILSGHLAGDAEAMARFEHEARTVAALSHPNILAIHDFSVQEGMPSTVTELLEGESLRDRLTRGALPWREAAVLGIAVADGLAAAHALGIVHRDLKPENLFLLRDGRVKILDFGLARQVLPSGPADTHLTLVLGREHGLVLGTLGYMSPEQARGGPVGVTSDIFSLGCVLYELVTGRRAFDQATIAETLSAILNEHPRPIEESGGQVPAEVARVILHCLEKQPSARFQSARDTAFALQALVNDTSVMPGARGGRSGRTATKAVAVLPFVNEGGDTELDYLCDALTEILANALAELPRLRVVPRTVAQRYKGRVLEPMRIGAELNATALVTGRVVARGGQVSVQAELIDAPSNALLWGQRFVRPATEIFALQEALAAEIVGALSRKLGGTKKPVRRTVAAHTPAPAAYEHYLRGRHAFQQWGSRGIAKAIEHLEQAILADPDYAPAWAGLSDALGASAYFGFSDPAVSMARAKSAAERASALDGTSAEAHAALAVALMFGGWDLERAGVAFRHAVALNPRLATTHAFHALYLSACGRPDEAIAEARKGEALDPVSPLTVLSVAWACHFAGRSDEGIAQLHRVLDVAPACAPAYVMLADYAEARGDYPKAIERVETALRLAGQPLDVAKALGSGWTSGGRQGYLRAKLSTVEHSVALFGDPQMVRAAVLTALGEHDLALGCLEAAFDLRLGGMVLMGAEPCFHPLHGQARFEALLGRVGLPGSAPGVASSADQHRGRLADP